MSVNVNAGYRFYRGDVVSIELGPDRVRAVVREVDLNRVKIQIGADWTWAFSGELYWNGECLDKLPRTERGWRKLGKMVTGA